MKISIRDAAGLLIEEGKASLNPIDRNKWNYTALQENPSVAGGTISAIASDIPGNKGTLDVIL